MLPMFCTSLTRRDGKSVESCLNMWEEALMVVPEDAWANCVRHCEQIIEDWWKREVAFDDGDVAPLIINLNDDSDSE
ncbi:hypothetical protein RN001_005230 [Aquatica leii]|uniref:Uncharacterized protein n=1 Tax=Aquatica leii TaxID=1421715 RepID=A0AAN7SAG8_9COLE|nr:hypothetical protein RN001_005230 [Aquatica leii]